MINMIEFDVAVNALGEDVLLVLKNTEDQDSLIFSKLNNNVKIRIIGGLDEESKPKYNISILSGHFTN